MLIVYKFVKTRGCRFENARVFFAGDGCEDKECFRESGSSSGFLIFSLSTIFFCYLLYYYNAPRNFDISVKYNQKVRHEH